MDSSGGAQACVRGAGHHAARALAPQYRVAAHFSFTVYALYTCRMRLLVVGNHACSNRGDAAILRGLLTGLQASAPEADIDVVSRFPVSASYLLARHIEADALHAFRQQQSETLLASRIKPHTSRLMVKALRRPVLRLALPTEVLRVVAQVAQYDAVIHVGGSYFVDLYGEAQYDWALSAFVAEVPYLLMGHSLGPFELADSRRLCAVLLEHARFVGLREACSRDALIDAGLRHDHVYMGSDTAWLVPVDESVHARDGLRVQGERPLVVITLRTLAPFEARLGIVQSDYEQGMARLADSLVERGHDVALASTCTGLDSYHRDDRIPALRVRQRMRRPQHCHVVMEELSDVELGELFASCALVVGTRLHSAIIAMNFGTIAVTLNYEHKSQGTMAQLGLADLSFAISSVVDGTIVPKVAGVLRDRSLIGERVRDAVERERGRAQAMLEAGLSLVPACASGDAHGGGPGGRATPAATGVDGQGQGAQHHETAQ